MFHPLNLEQNALQRMSGVAMLQRSKRVRPEDVDLPAPIEESSYLEYYTAQSEYMNQINMLSNPGEVASKTEETDKALKRKKFLSAQLNFSKKVLLKMPLNGNEAKKSECAESLKESSVLVCEKEYQQQQRQKAGFTDEEISIKLADRTTVNEIEKDDKKIIQKENLSKLLKVVLTLRFFYLSIF